MGLPEIPGWEEFKAISRTKYLRRVQARVSQKDLLKKDTKSIDEYRDKFDNIWHKTELTKKKNLPSCGSERT